MYFFSFHFYSTDVYLDYECLPLPTTRIRPPTCPSIGLVHATWNNGLQQVGRYSRTGHSANAFFCLQCWKRPMIKTSTLRLVRQSWMVWRRVFASLAPKTETWTWVRPWGMVAQPFAWPCCETPVPMLRSSVSTARVKPTLVKYLNSRSLWL